MKTKIQITHWLTGSILFEFETENNSLYRTLKEALDCGANLRGANLYGANLYGANLRGANLREADLYGADLREANLYGANLRGADLYGADLRGADLYGADGLDYWWHVHHEVLYENLTEPVRNRINYIKEHKPKHEIKIRLKLLKPVLGEIPRDADGWNKLHKKECIKNCPWNGKTIFPDEKTI